VKMLNFRKWFVPGKHNNFQPHALRATGLFVAVFILLAVNLTYNIAVAHTPKVLGYATSISSDQIIALTNQQRAANGLGALATNSELNSAANAKAQDMFAKNYWSHYSPDGTGPWYWITAAGYDYSSAGENLAKDFSTSQGVVDGWMASPAHRDNILNASYADIGVAAVNGVLLGSETTLVVAMYGAPVAAAAAAPAAAPSVKSESTTATPTPAPAATTTPDQTPPAETPQANTETKASAPAASTTNATPRLNSTKQVDAYQAVKVKERRTWAQNASLYVVSVLLLLNVLKHTVVWRTQKRGWRNIWLRAHPAAQYALLMAAILVNVTSGVGVIR
jgi:hypothetical protein